MESILAWMRGKSRTFGWDAIVSYNREKTNALFEQQYVSKIERNSLLAPVTREIRTPLGEHYEVRGLRFGAPLLSFENASLVDSSAALTMNMLSGTVATVSATAGAPRSILEYSRVTPVQQFKATANVELKHARGMVSDIGKVVLDVADGVDFTTNLVHGDLAQSIAGQFLKEQFLENDPQARVYDLGTLTGADAGALTPKRFQIRTQAAPGARDVRAASYGSGAVVLFVQTRDSEHGGSNPDDLSDFRFLIPDDTDATGRHLYDTALIVGSRTLFQGVVAPIYARQFDARFVLEDTAAGASTELRAISGRYVGSPLEIEWFYWLQVGPNPAHKYLCKGVTFSESDEQEKVQLYFAPDYILSAQDDALHIKWDSNRPHLLRVYERLESSPWHEIARSLVEFVFRSQVKLESRVDSETNQVSLVKRDEHISADVNISRLYPAPDKQWSKDRTVIAFRNALSRAVSEFYDVRLPGIDVFSLANLLFPEQNAIRLTQARVPGDLALFGHLDPKQTSFRITPLQPVVAAGQTQQFEIESILSRNDVVAWSVHTLGQTTALGSIDANGRYRAPEAGLLTKAAVQEVITATRNAGTPNEQTASAMLTVVAEAVMVTPDFKLSAAGGKPVTLTAWVAGGAAAGPVTWELAPGSLGTLEPQPGGLSAVYTPPTATRLLDARAPVQADVVFASAGGQRGQAGMLAMTKDPSLQISPALAHTVGAGGSVALSIDTGEPELAAQATAGATWSVIMGGGSVNAQGVYQAPATIEAPYAIVAAEAGTSPFISRGYSVIPLARPGAVANWDRLATFELEVASGSAQLFRNGRQQVLVRLKIKAIRGSGGGEEFVRLSPDEIQSIQLTYRHGDAPLPFIPADGVANRWAVNRQRNSYEYYPAGSREAEILEDGEYDSINLWVQTTDDAPQEFGAQITRDDFAVFRSRDPGGEKAFVKVEPVPVPQFDNELFGWDKVRKEGGDDDDWNLRTIDNYYLSINAGGGQFLPIVAIECTPLSIIQWESENPSERMATYTGYAQPGSTQALYDPRLLDKMGSYSPPVDIQDPAAGKAVFVMIRRDDVRYIPDIPDNRGSHAVTAFDHFGNPHRLRVRFKSPTDRNELVVERG
ncbi:hypothetical protein WM04_15475 [Burkholderia ubonensis]|uniref:hypothetical protein n=1 Tax=Burkholderia ubonensis TaxID=101571 RepID=UPI00076CF625|nr:hypothetical protein [Burkholderia ubonensis]KWI31325.1 hypothetical protein WM04_15475 [Burkholderia ubonensis]OJB11817.1 hypothetical protein BGV53_27770 [Burkholderia ubonensis]